MEKKTGFELRDICGEKVIIATGIENLDFSNMITLNESAAYLWETTGDEPLTAQLLAALLCKEYDVTPDVALRDSEALLADWQTKGIVE